MRTNRTQPFGYRMERGKVVMEFSKEIDWLRIQLTPENKQVVLGILRSIHVPGEVFEDSVYVYGYRTDVGYV